MNLKRIQSSIAVVLCGFLAGPAANPVSAQTESVTLNDHPGFITSLTYKWRPHRVSEVSFEDSPRLERLVRAGVIYLSLRDAIALALENNLDIEVARYYPKLALSDVQRAEAGQLLRNVSTNFSNGPSSASLSVLAGASQVNAAGASGSSTGGTSALLSGLSVNLAGAAIPNTEPYAYVASSFYHTTNIETSTQFTGTPFLVQQYKQLIYGFQQNYWTGTQVSVGMTSVFGYNQNALTALFNPIDTGQLSFTIQQNLLNGFGIATNKRALHKAQNNIKANDLNFKQQVILTVANVVNLYYDLVSFNRDLAIDRETYELDKRLYEDNQKRADLGAIAPIDIIQAEAEMKSAEQAVVAQQSQVEQQEMILKSVLTRSGLDNPAIAAAHIVPTTTIEVPAQDNIAPTQEMIAEALANRPEVAQNNITLDNARLDMLGTKSNLLPTLVATASLANSGQGGALNPAVQVPITGPNGNIVGYRPLGPGDVSSTLIGGYGTALGQIFSRNFPNYNVGFQLTVPLRNRANEADHITAELNFRQSQIQDRQLKNNIKLNVMNAVTALRNARAAYETSVVARKLQDETLAGTRRKYELGTATILDVVIAQRDDTTRQLSEADARNQYQRSRTNLQQMMGTILEDNNVNLDEAKNGMVGREPDLPVAPSQQQQQR
ncbi:MAG TPA: TolC family protein [Bryobacteraceae bacterium]|nr:TolC family protein [Bryobacteraceae bacterium]